MEQLSYKLEVFEGPLDLLLNLIAKNKLSIYDIQISELLDQYMEQIRLMQEEDMDVASEFLSMAARLVQIKSISLLPKHEEEEELKKELIGQLLEYQTCKLIAAKMAPMVSFDRLIKAPENIPIDQRYSRNHESSELVTAYLSAVGRGKRFLPPPAERFRGIVSRRVVSVASQIVSILKGLFKSGQVKYKSLFSKKKERSERVAAFLAVLELVKDKRLRVEGDGDESVVKLINGGDQTEKTRTYGDN